MSVFGSRLCGESLCNMGERVRYPFTMMWKSDLMSAEEMSRFVEALQPQDLCLGPTLVLTMTSLHRQDLWVLSLRSQGLSPFPQMLLLLSGLASDFLMSLGVVLRFSCCSFRLKSS